MQLEKKTKRKESIKSIECRDELVDCEQLAGVSVNVCGAAEAPEEQGWKVNGIQEFPGQGTLEN